MYKKFKIESEIPARFLAFKDEVEEDEIRKYASLFKVKLNENNIEKVNSELLKAHKADIQRKNEAFSAKNKGLESIPAPNFKKKQAIGTQLLEK